jgi:hypothetical protein
MLKELGDLHYSRGNTTSKSSRVAHYIKHCQVELVILDEFHHLINQETHHVLVTASEWLKTLIINTGVSVVAFGMASGERVLNFRADPNEEDSQLGSRFAIRYRLEPFKWDGGRLSSEFTEFLERVDQALPLAQKSYLSDTDFARRIHYATGGLARRVMQMLERAMELAVGQGLERIEMKHLRRAFEDRIRSGYSGRRNPFEVQDFSDELAVTWSESERRSAPKSAVGRGKGSRENISDILSTK